MKRQILIIFLIFAINTVFWAATQEEAKSEKDAGLLFRQAKKCVYKKDWKNAVKKLDTIVKDFPESRWIDDSLYWLGYSLNKDGDTLTGFNKILAAKEEALTRLTSLIQKYPRSNWVDDAELLTVEIAEELVRKGLKKYKKYILNGVKEYSDKAIKLVAIEALMNLDREKAFPKLVKIIRENKDPELRARAAFVLGHHHKDPRVVELLVELARTDPDSEVKEQAIFWLGQFRTEDSFKQLLKLYKSTDDLELKKKLVFAIARVRSEKAVEELIKIYKKEKDLELKKQIILWLGSVNNKKAQKFILEILE